jgi:hypothetical protein
MNPVILAIIKQCFKISYLYILTILLPSLKIINFAIDNYDKKLYTAIEELVCMIYEYNTQLENPIYNNINHNISNNIKNTLVSNIKNACNGMDISIDCETDSNISDYNYETESCIGSISDEKIYAMKLRSINKNEPDYDNMSNNEIHVNTKQKIFYIKTNEGFECFDLPAKSIVKCDRN